MPLEEKVVILLVGLPEITEQQIVEMAAVEQMDLAEHHQTAATAVQASLFSKSPLSSQRHSLAG